MRFLMVEDEQALRKNIDQYLTAEGNTCDFASNYEQGHQKLSIYNYDCVLLDLTLPDGEGLPYLLPAPHSNGLKGITYDI